ncbi:unnamed protein product [Chrysoparadoxa australica]
MLGSVVFLTTKHNNAQAPAPATGASDTSGGGGLRGSSTVGGVVPVDTSAGEDEQSIDAEEMREEESENEDFDFGPSILVTGPAERDRDTYDAAPDSEETEWEYYLPSEDYDFPSDEEWELLPEEDPVELDWDRERAVGKMKEVGDWFRDVVQRESGDNENVGYLGDWVSDRVKRESTDSTDDEDTAYQDWAGDGVRESNEGDENLGYLGDSSSGRGNTDDEGTAYRQGRDGKADENLGYLGDSPNGRGNTVNEDNPYLGDRVVDGVRESDEADEAPAGYMGDWLTERLQVKSADEEQGSLGDWFTERLYGNNDNDNDDDDGNDYYYSEGDYDGDDWDYYGGKSKVKDNDGPTKEQDKWDLAELFKGALFGGGG